MLQLGNSSSLRFECTFLLTRKLHPMHRLHPQYCVDPATCYSSEVTINWLAFFCNCHLISNVAFQNSSANVMKYLTDNYAITFLCAVFVFVAKCTVDVFPEERKNNMLVTTTVCISLYHFTCYWSTFFKIVIIVFNSSIQRLHANINHLTSG